jgi:hypothetical protein
MAAFSHKNTDLHSYEVDQGAIHALMLQLGYCLSTKTNTSSTTTVLQDEELLFLHIITQCLHQILSQCATRHKVMMWQELGATELVPLLLQLPGGTGWSVLRLFCKLPMAKSSLIRYPRLVGQIVTLLEGSDQQPAALVGELVGALKDLCFRAEGVDKKLLWKTPGLNEELVAIVMSSPTNAAENCAGPAQHEDIRWSERNKEYIATYWWNLALHDSVKEEIQADSAVVSALQKLLQEPSVKIRCSAVAALGNLVTTSPTADEDNRGALLQQNDAFWNTLQHLCLHEEDTDCRRRVVRTLRCLLAHTPKPASMYVLAQVASKDADTDTRLQALEGMRYLQSSAGAECWTQALVGIMEGASDARVTWVACQMLPAKARELEPTDAFWTAIAQVVELIPESHGRIMELMTSIAQNAGHDKVVTSPVALATLGKLVLTQQQATLNLLQELVAQDGKKRLAECDELLSALVTLCLSTTGDEKDVAKGIILQLVPEL